MDQSETFPFGLEDIQGWLIRRKDGVLVRYTLINAAADAGREKVKGGSSANTSNVSYSYPKKSYSEWCEIHAPTPEQDPVFEADNIRLYIANSTGARKNAHLFDVAIDGGNVLDVPGEHDLPVIYGDPRIKGKLERFVIREGSKKLAEWPKIVKIRWYDRCPPPVTPAFWPALLGELKRLQESIGRPLNLVTICQGGHGRSGSALAALMMCLSNYTPLDALTHIRALHCARAIESKDQHIYLNAVGMHLGREANALDAEKVTSFKNAFLEGEYDELYKARLRSGKGATVTEREGKYL